MLKNAISNWVHTFASLVYPPACEICGGSVEHEKYLCSDCENKAPRIRAPFCDRCSEPFSGAITGSFACANCSHRTLHFEQAVAVFRSRGIVRKLVHEFKYHRQQHLRHPIGSWLCQALEDPRLRDQRFNMIVPVPLHSARQRERGFNQAELLAQILAATSGIPLQNSLQRVRYTTTQTDFDRAERMENLRGAFRLRRCATVRGSRVLLVDDVMTTGSTLSECARVLKEQGAVSVHASTAARA